MKGSEELNKRNTYSDDDTIDSLSQTINDQDLKKGFYKAIKHTDIETNKELLESLQKRIQEQESELKQELKYTLESINKNKYDFKYIKVHPAILKMADEYGSSVISEVISEHDKLGMNILTQLLKDINYLPSTLYIHENPDLSTSLSVAICNTLVPIKDIKIFIGSIFNNVDDIV